MALSRPTIPELIEEIRAEFESGFANADTYLRRSVEYVLTRVLAGLFNGVYGHLYGFVLRQIFPDTAIEEYFWRWFAIWLERKAAVYWKGTVTFTGTPTTSIPADTEIQRSDGYLYATDEDAVIGAGGSIDVAVTAATPGADWNCTVGQTLSLTGTISGVDTDATVASSVQTGVDVEDKDDGLPRLLQRLREPPSGGGPGDYERWALEVAGVTRAWEFPNLPAVGGVSLAFVRDDESPITPDLTERNEVKDYIEETYQPTTAVLEVIELSTLAVPVTFSALSPNTSTVQAAIAAALEDLFLREAEPGGTIPLSKFIEAISSATGEESHTITAPAADVTATSSQIPILGTVTFP